MTLQFSCRLSSPQSSSTSKGPQKTKLQDLPTIKGYEDAYADAIPYLVYFSHDPFNVKDYHAAPISMEDDNSLRIRSEKTALRYRT